MDQIFNTPGPRRYRVTFDCGGQLGSLVDTLMKETEGFNLTPAGEGRFKMTFIAVQDRLADIIAIITAEPTSEQITVRPDVAEQVARPYPPVSAARTFDRTAIAVRAFAPTHPALRGPKMTRDNPPGRCIMGLLNTMVIIRAPDVHDAFNVAGINTSSASNTLSRLVAEGSLIRHSRGAYRLPTTEEQTDLIRRRQIMAGGATSSPQHPAGGGSGT